MGPRVADAGQLRASALARAGIGRRGAPAASHDTRICLIMDTSELRDLLIEILSEGRAPCATTPQDDPLPGVWRSRPDLIVMDLGWGPSMRERIGTIHALRAEEELRSVPMLAVTTDPLAARRHRAELKQLSVRMVMLPVDLGTLEARVGALLGV